MGPAFIWIADSPPARPRPAPWPRCGTRRSGAGYPDAKVFVLELRRGGLHRQGVSDGEVLPHLGAGGEVALSEGRGGGLHRECSARRRWWTSGPSARTPSPSPAWRAFPCLGLGPGNEVYAHAPNEACPSAAPERRRGVLRGAGRQVERKGLSWHPCPFVPARAFWRAGKLEACGRTWRFRYFRPDAELRQPKRRVEGINCSSSL